MYYLKKRGEKGATDLDLDIYVELELILPIEKIIIQKALFELPDIELPIQPICLIFKVNGLDWQYYLACSSKTAPRIFISLHSCHGC